MSPSSWHRPAHGYSVWSHRSRLARPLALSTHLTLWWKPLSLLWMHRSRIWTLLALLWRHIGTRLRVFRVSSVCSLLLLRWILVVALPLIIPSIGVGVDDVVVVIDVRCLILLLRVVLVRVPSVAAVIILRPTLLLLLWRVIMLLLLLCLLFMVIRLLRRAFITIQRIRWKRTRCDLTLRSSSLVVGHVVLLLRRGGDL